MIKKRVVNPFTGKLQIINSDEGAIGPTGPTGPTHVQNTDQYLTTQVNNVLYVDNKRTDDYIENGSITKPFKTIQAANDAISGNISTNRFVIKVATGSYYSEVLTLNKDYTTLEGYGATVLTGAITISSPHVRFSNLQINSAVTLNLESHFLLEVANCSTGPGVWNITASAPTGDEWFQISGDVTIWKANVNATGITGVASIAGGYFEGVQTYTNCWVELMGFETWGTINLEADTEATIGAVLPMSATVNLKTGAILNADATFMGSGLTLNNTGGTLNLNTESSYIKNDSDVLGATVKDALNNLNKNNTSLDIILENGYILPTVASGAYFCKVLYSSTAKFSDGSTLYKYIAFFGDRTATSVAYSNDGYTWINETALSGITSGGYHGELVLVGSVLYYYYWNPSVLYAPDAIRRATIDITTNCAIATIDVGLTGSYITGISGDLRYGSYGPSNIFYNASPTNNISNPYTYQWCMIFMGTTGGEEGILFAVSTDGLNFSAWNGLTEVITRGTYPEWDAYIGASTIWQDSTGLWNAFYSGGVGTAHGADSNYADGIGHATSTDGITWTKNAANPIVGKACSYKTAKRCYTPCLVKEDDGWRLYFTAKSQSGAYRISKAIVNILK